MKNILMFLIIFMTILASFVGGLFFSKQNYSIFGFGEGSIMLDGRTGEAWILEIIQSPSSSFKGHLLNCENDFCGAKGLRYNWVPTAITPCFDNKSLCRTADEARKTDEEALKRFGLSLQNLIK